MPEAIILAGGKGTRLAERLHGLPKPLVSVAGEPLLQRQLLLLKSVGILDVTILVNYKAGVIAEFCRAHQDFGMRLRMVDDGVPRGTAGATLAAFDHMPQCATDLLVLYGDTLLNVDFGRLFAFHKGHAGAATLFLHPNNHPQDSDLVEVDSQGRILAIHAYPHPPKAIHANLVNAALYVLRRDAFDPWRSLVQERPRIIDFAKDLFPLMLASGHTLYGYNSPEYIKDIGTPERLDSAEKDIATRRYATGSLASPRSAVFLDRDGVINREMGFLHHRENLTILPRAAEAIRRLNQAGLLCVAVTNQPVIARGECTEEELVKIHAWMDTLLGREGAYLDRLYYCPHHPDTGYAGERPELKIACKCRKPEIGMLEQAQQDLNIDLSRSWLIGDQTSDILCARRAGVRSILVRTGFAGTDGKYAVVPDDVAEDIYAATDIILQQKNSSALT